MTGLLIMLAVVMVISLITNIWAAVAGKFEFRVETDMQLAGLDDLIRRQMSGATLFQKTEGSLERGYQRTLKRGLGPYRSEALIVVDVLPIGGSEAVVVQGWIEGYVYGRQLFFFADPFGPAPIWGAFKLRKVLKALEHAAREGHAQIEVETDHDGHGSRLGTDSIGAPGTGNVQKI